MSTYCNPKPYTDLWLTEHGYKYVDYWNLAMFGALRRTFPVPHLQYEFSQYPEIFKLLPSWPAVAQELGFKWYQGSQCPCRSHLRHPYEDHCINCASKKAFQMPTPSELETLEKHRSKMRAALPKVDQGGATALPK